MKVILPIILVKFKFSFYVEIVLLNLNTTVNVNSISTTEQSVMLLNTKAGSDQSYEIDGHQGNGI